MTSQAEKLQSWTTTVTTVGMIVVGIVFGYSELKHAVAQNKEDVAKVAMAQEQESRDRKVDTHAIQQDIRLLLEEISKLKVEVTALRTALEERKPR